MTRARAPRCRHERDQGMAVEVWSTDRSKLIGKGQILCYSPLIEMVPGFACWWINQSIAEQVKQVLLPRRKPKEKK